MSFSMRATSKANYATVVPHEKPVTQTPTTMTATVIKATECRELVPSTWTKDVAEKRDFHWQHPVYTRDEYEKIQVSRD